MPTPQVGLSRIAEHAAAIASEVERMLELNPNSGTGGEDKLGQALVEMRAMSRLLAETRAEVLGLSPPPADMGDTLDAVVGDTEGAALEILRQAERAQAAAGRLHAGTSTNTTADLAEVDEAATAIVLACAFQDLTGQRVRKVLAAMRQVEARIAGLFSLLGISPEELSTVPEAATPSRPDAHLLNGPSTAAQGGLGQSAVDDLFG